MELDGQTWQLMSLPAEPPLHPPSQSLWVRKEWWTATAHHPLSAVLWAFVFVCVNSHLVALGQLSGTNCTGLHWAGVQRPLFSLAAICCVSKASTKLSYSDSWTQGCPGPHKALNKPPGCGQNPLPSLLFPLSSLSLAKHCHLFSQYYWASPRLKTLGWKTKLMERVPSSNWMPLKLLCKWPVTLLGNSP